MIGISFRSKVVSHNLQHLKDTATLYSLLVNGVLGLSLCLPENIQVIFCRLVLQSQLMNVIEGFANVRFSFFSRARGVIH